MRRVVAIAVVFTSLGIVLGFNLRGGSSTANAGQQVEECATKNGDVNADVAVDLSDAVTILGNLFLGNPPQLLPLCASSPTGLPDTGQATCYDPSGPGVPCDNATRPGQDGQYATGCPTEGRFADNGDGTVTDSCTGLMWQKDPADMDGNGTPSGVDAVTWFGALAYCENLSFAGHDDWRLPNVRELQSIVDYGRSDPAIDPVFNATGATVNYWSSTSGTDFSLRGWYVTFSLGEVFPSDKSTGAYVRAVRDAS